MTRPRISSKEELIAGLRAGRVAVIVRRDAPELQDLVVLERDGYVTSELVETDEQSTVLKFRWRADTPPPVEETEQ